MSKEKEIIQDKALDYIKAQLSVIPVKEDKLPALTTWKKYQTIKIKPNEIETFFTGANVKGVGIICGAISGGLEVIDIDTKYDLTGNLWEGIKEQIKDSLGDIFFYSLTIAQTRSGGYHIYFRSDNPEGNKKLANRYTTPQEREKTYQDNKQKGDTEEEAKKKANNDKIRVLIETRGEGGYVVAPPTQGYKLLQGDPPHTLIKTITKEERDILLNIARSFNQVEEETYQKTNKAYQSSATLTAIEDYNKRGDVVALLQSNGFTVVSSSGEKIQLLRPGATDSKTSGNFHTTYRRLFIFSTSSGLPTDRGLTPFEVFSYLEAEGNDKKAESKLIELGFGGDLTQRIQTERITVSKVNRVTGETTVICEPGNYLNPGLLKINPEEDILIDNPEPREGEVLKAIDSLLSIGVRIYVKEKEKELREYNYQLRSIFRKYGTIQEETGGLTDREKDNFLDEIVNLSTRLQPIDRSILIKELLELEAIRELGITEESLSITVDRLAATKDKEAKAQEFNNLLSKVNSLTEKGKTEEAIQLLGEKLKDVKLKDRATEFNKLLLPTSESQIREDLQSAPGDLDTGYTINGYNLLLPGGALTVFAGATGHGKTILSINTALNVAKANPNKKFIFFTYEENYTAILQYFVNTYINIELNSSTDTKRGNRRVLKDYFKTGSTQYIAREKVDKFITKKDEFLREYIETGRILVKYVDYSSTELEGAIRYLHTKEPQIAGVFIDYFQLLNLPGDTKRAERINSRQEELKYICQQLKKVAVDTGLPICLAAQFNREVINLEDIHSTNVGEAGDIERIVNTLVGIYDLSKAKDPTHKSKKITEEKEGMYLELLKSRDLPTGSYEVLSYNGKTGKVENKPYSPGKESGQEKESYTI
jgi:replicative DNA helicase